MQLDGTAIWPGDPIPWPTCAPASRGRPAPRAILPSADRLIFRPRQIGRSADDTTREDVYRAAMRIRRPDPVKLDWAVAALLAVGGQLEVWLGTGAHGERPVVATSGTILAAAVAVRRRFPAAAGITAAAVANVVAVAWRPPSLVTYGVA